MSSLSRLKPLVPVLVLVAIAAAYWMLLISPKRDEASALDTKIAGAGTTLAQTEATAAGYEKARVSYKANYAKLVRLGKAVPDDDNVRSLLIELEAAAHRSGVTFRSLNVGATQSTPAAPGTATTPTTGTVPGAVPVEGTDLSAMDFDLAFDGTFFNTSQLLTRLEKFVALQNRKMSVTGRLLRLESVDLEPGENWKQLTASIKARAYLMPAVTPLGGAGSSAAPATGATATPASTPATPSAPTTTASITTGVTR